MFKKLFLLLAVMPLLFSCDKAPKTPEVKVYDVMTLLPEADTLVGKEVTIRGKVTYVCSHTAMKCMVESADSPELTIRVMATDSLNKFDPEIIGEVIEVTGILKEQRIEEEKIAALEDAVKEKIEKAEGEEEKQHCDSEKNNVENMRKWMKDHNKEYYATYYMEYTPKYKVIKEESAK